LSEERMKLRSIKELGRRCRRENGARTKKRRKKEAGSDFETKESIESGECRYRYIVLAMSMSCDRILGHGVQWEWASHAARFKESPVEKSTLDAEVPLLP